MPLYGYLYVDLPKVISLYSQITGGVVESRETTQEKTRSSDNKRVALFEIDAKNTVNILAVRHQREEDYH
jgi:plasmid stabilization system protein ParE